MKNVIKRRNKGFPIFFNFHYEIPIYNFRFGNPEYISYFSFLCSPLFFVISPHYVPQLHIVVQLQEKILRRMKKPT
jgi:hypothetical protein